MSSKFLKEEVEGERFSLLIDASIFNKDIVLKSAYNFLDKGYFFFRIDQDGNIVLEFTRKKDIQDTSQDIIGEFSDEILNVYLRDKLEKDNKIIRETIVTKAINGPLDMQNFVSLDLETSSKQNEIDFDKDIDEILKEIENDPDLKIDEEEIESILKEIEEESKVEASKPVVKADLGAISDAKKMFKKNK